MKILGLEKVSFVDYEGKICATIFTGGCNFRCPFCHNSSLVNENSPSIDENEILNYLKERKPLLDAVTISGGEPCLQPDLFEYIKKVKAMGYEIKLDTNGTFPKVVEKLVNENLIDYVAIDIKNSYSTYQSISGVKNPQTDNIKQTLNLLKQAKANYELRTTLVQEFHSIESIKKIANDLNGENILYLQKFVDNGTCIANNLNAISKETALQFKEILSKTIKNVYLRGY